MIKEAVKIKINNLSHDLLKHQIERQKNNLDKNQVSKFKKELGNKSLKAKNIGDEADKLQKLEQEAEKFTAIFLEKMFSAMKKTLPEEKMLDGGFAEDVFSDMLTKEYSQMAGKQGLLADLNKSLINQLKDS